MSTEELLYLVPYVRVAGLLSKGAAVPDISRVLASFAAEAADAKEAALRRARQSPFVAPPPQAVTTHSFSELLKSRTRPGRYGPAEVRGQFLAWKASAPAFSSRPFQPSHPALAHPQIYPKAVTEGQETGWRVAQAFAARKA